MVRVCVWKISPKNVKFFNFFHLGSKKSLRAGSKSTWVNGGLVSYLLRVKSMLRSDQGLSLLVCSQEYSLLLIWLVHLIPLSKLTPSIFMELPEMRLVSLGANTIKNPIGKGSFLEKYEIQIPQHIQTNWWL